MSATPTDPFAWWQQWLKQAPALPLPGFAVPTLDIDELDRRIREYRTVEGWLQMNLSSVQMMRQSLEMQRAAVAAWQELNQNWQQAPEAKSETPPAAPSEKPHTIDSGSSTQPPPVPNPFEMMKVWWENATQAMTSAAAEHSASASSRTASSDATHTDVGPDANTKPAKRKRTTKRKAAPAAGSGESGSGDRNG